MEVRFRSKVVERRWRQGTQQHILPASTTKQPGVGCCKGDRAGSGEEGGGSACCWGFRRGGAVTEVVSWLVQGGRGWVWFKGRCTMGVLILNSVAPIITAGMTEKWWL
ncbi:hypothetical protein SESBI_44914 [Sesbania bispinosa]|nr:hypothetical protein SESBI_44914 [Sesbania bispinosa]